MSGLGFGVVLNVWTKTLNLFNLNVCSRREGVDRIPTQKCFLSMTVMFRTSLCDMEIKTVTVFW